MSTFVNYCVNYSWLEDYTMSSKGVGEVVNEKKPKYMVYYFGSHVNSDNCIGKEIRFLQKLFRSKMLHRQLNVSYIGRWYGQL